MLAQSNSINIIGTGIQNFPITATVPASGNVWAGFETQSKLLTSKTEVTSGRDFVTHTYGTGPSPFGSVSTASEALWMSLTYDLPNFSISPSNGPIGKRVFLDGDNFNNNKVANIYFDGTLIDTTVTFNNGTNDGVVNAYITIPLATVGAHTINVTDTGSPSKTATATYTIVSPNVFLDTANGMPGGSVSTKGNSFINNTSLTLNFDTNTLATDPGLPTTNSTGGFNKVNFTIPEATAGHHNINFTDGSGNFAIAILNVTSLQIVTPGSGVTGDHVTINGYGFTGSHTITINFDGTNITPGTVTTNSKGSFSAILTIPSATIGSHTISSTDSHHTTSSTFFITSGGSGTNTPALTISPTKGSVGTKVTMTGNNFNATSHMNFYFNNVLIGTTPVSVTTNSTGSFSGVTLTVPNLALGTYVIKAVDSGSNQANKSFTIINAVPDAPSLSAYSISQTAVRFVSVAGSSSGDFPVKDYSFRCRINSGSLINVVTNSTLPATRSYDYTGLQPSDSITCSWRDGSLAGWSNWSNNATSTTQLSIVEKPRAPNSNPLMKVISFIDKEGGVYFGFSVLPLAVLLIGMMATPKTVGIFALATIFLMGILQGSGFVVYPSWYWGIIFLLGICIVLSKANQKET